MSGNRFMQIQSSNLFYMGLITNKDFERYCALKRQCPILYNKLETGGNDPKISRRMQYANYVRNYK